MKYGLYSKNNLEECIITHSTFSLGLASLYFRMGKKLPQDAFDKLFEVKKIE